MMIEKIRNNNMNSLVYKTASSFYPDIVCNWLFRVIIMLIVFFYSIFDLPFYLGIPYILIAFYLIFVKFFQYKSYRFFYKIEFNDENQLITFYYRANLFKKGKYVLPYSELSLWHRKTILSTSTFIIDKRKEKFFKYVGVIVKEKFFGKKYWNRELYNLVVTKMNSIV